MKNLILSAVLLTSVSAYASVTTVKDAQSAEIKGLPAVQGIGGEGWIKVYPGVSFFKSLPGVLSKMFEPTVTFFDKQGNKILQEKLTDVQVLENPSNAITWANYKAIIKVVRARLALKPKVRSAVVVQGMKGPERQSIQLFDKKGNLIACTDFENWGLLVVGDNLPKKAIKELADFVSNYEVLENLKIQSHKKLVNLSNILD